MSEPYIASIFGWGPNWAPRGWNLCMGQILAISQYEALYSLIGDTYGGDGRTTFGLPDMRGRLTFSHGQSPGLHLYEIGSRGGAETVTLTQTNLPSHNHTANTNSFNIITPAATGSTEASPSGSEVFGAIQGSAGVTPLSASLYADVDQANTSLAPGSIVGTPMLMNNGAGLSTDIRDPYQAISFIIAMVGVFPSRN